MSQDDFWNKLATGHVNTTVLSAVDSHISSKPFGPAFEQVRSLTEAGKRARALKLPVEAGVRVSFSGDPGAVFSMEDPPELGSFGEVVTVKSANGDITHHEGKVFVKWDDGKFRSVHAEYLHLAKKEEDPCWEGYEMVGTKEKGGKQVPNCVPVKKASFSSGQRVQVKRDHWTGQGSRSGAVVSSSPRSGKVLVRFDDGTLVDMDDRSIEPQGKRASVEDINPYARKLTYEQFKKVYFSGEGSVPDRIAREFWDDFKWAFRGPLSRYVKETSSRYASRSELPLSVSMVRVASLGDLDDFLKLSSDSNTLIHRPTKELWSFKKDADGAFLVERLFDENGQPLKG
jgi:hypothetical protein